MKPKCYALIAGLLLLAANATLAADKTPLMHFPDVHKNTVVFVSGEDIWSVPADGGVAMRLTFHDGAERYPKFSPDGTLIAFTGEYDGNADVYVMNRYGGDITRVTFHPGYDEVVGWHPTKNKIMFRSNRKSFSRFSRLFLIEPDGTGLEEVILPEAVQGSFSADGKQIAYNKVSRENRTWKRYKGGTAQEVYLYNFETGEERNLTQFPGTDRIPMWIGEKIYFSSDRDKVLNIYSCDPATGAIEPITHHTEYDVRRPSMGEDKIVYELGGDIWLLDVNSGETGEIPIEVYTDAPDLRPHWKKVDHFVTGFDCSPAGERALVVARGEIFSVPGKHGATRNLSNSPGSREKDAAWSPDGKWIAYLSDESGEYEIYLLDARSQKNPVQLTHHKDGYRHTLRWSPDSKKIAFADQTLRCYILDVASKKISEVDKAEYESIDVSLDRKPISDFAWSPDSRYLAYSKMNADLVFQVYVYDSQTGKRHRVSNGLFNDFGPAFAKDGKHLFFISNRRFDPTFGDFEWEMVYKKVAGIYALTLQRDGESLLPLQEDVVQIKTGEAEKGKQEQAAASGVPDIDFDGIAARIEALPLPRGNYRYLATNASALFYMNKNEGDFNRFEFRPVGAMNLYAFDFAKRQERSVIEKIDGYKFSADGAKIVYKQGNAVGIIDAGAEKSPGNKLDLADLTMWLDPMAEWQQMFHEAWRMERDFYYEPNMHGLDWPAMREKYAKLLARATCRQDIRFVIGELIAELSTSHTYIFGGDIERRAKRVPIGMLGVDWEVDAANLRYRIEKIYRVPDWTQEVVPPLAGPGKNIAAGDYLLQVNGVEVTTDVNIYSYFENLAGKPVTLRISKTPNLAEARTITVKPLRGERTLRYLDWVEHNRQVADRESNGQIGYIHLPDTYMGSAREFPKYFYSQTRKKGLIIDGRFNAGGLDPDIFLQRLDKKVLAYWTRRYSHDQTSPAVVTRAHMVCLTNRQAGSGGDMLPMEFRMLGMGPIIGTRTWGGLVGVSMWIGLVDGGGMSAPDYRIYAPSGKWIVENEGIEPDITVDLHPKEVARGYDAQLMKGIEVLQQKIKEDPRPWPKHESFPIDR